jgi:hypothetical protein
MKTKTAPISEMLFSSYSQFQTMERAHKPVILKSKGVSTLMNA